MSPASNARLAGRGIVVTRPAHQAEHLATLIRAAGGDAILFPVIEIRDVGDPRALHAVIDRLDEFDLAIFASPNAVNRAMRLIASRRPLPPGLGIAAIGPGSRRELERCGLMNAFVPAGRADSEALLETPQLREPAGKRVVIFRGEGGRELLADTLEARGARVEHAVCYRRARPVLDTAPLLEALARQALAAVTVTSSEGVRNLHEMAGGDARALLAAIPHFAPHPRVAATARELGVATAIVAEGPGDEGLVAALVGYFDKSK